MKRYRIFPRDFDSQSMLLKLYMGMNELKEQDQINKSQILSFLKTKYGENNFEAKVQNFIAIDSKPFSVIAYHNKFLEQIRNAFVIGSYYSSLTATCALGERILNHLIINLREHYKDTVEYSTVSGKTIDNWKNAINALEAWGILQPEAIKKYQLLKKIRNRSLHFNLETEKKDREEALEAILILQAIITEQFAAFGLKPWFIVTLPGEIYIKKEWESHPYVKLIYIPNAPLVGYNHTCSWQRNAVLTEEKTPYAEGELSDEEFIQFRKKAINYKEM